MSRKKHVKPVKIKIFTGSAKKVDLKKIDAAYTQKFGPSPIIRKSIFNCINHEVDRSPVYPTSFVNYSRPDPEEISEYDVDSTDLEWLQSENQRRSIDGLVDIPENILQQVIDRIEKEKYNEYPDFPGGSGCSVCGKTETKESDDILYCDLCNVGVHQGCYGVEFVSQGMWLCRKCILSPEETVKCELCPLREGAFKPTLENKWAHVSCAMWIDETSFKSTRRMDLIKGVEKALETRAPLTCVICKLPTGACLQCSKKNCATAFHVTCGLNAGLNMKVKVMKWKSDDDFEVKRTAFCHEHGGQSIKEDYPMKRRKAIEAIRSSRTKKEYTPVVSRVPSINDELKERLKAITGDVDHVLQDLLDYWIYKSVKKGGAPLITREAEAKSDDEEEEEDEAVDEGKKEKEVTKREKVVDKKEKKNKETDESNEVVSKAPEKKMVKEERENAKMKSVENLDEIALPKMITRASVKVEKKEERKKVMGKREKDQGMTGMERKEEEKVETERKKEIAEKEERNKMVMIKKEKDQARIETERKKEMVVKKEEKVEIERKKEMVVKKEEKVEIERKKEIAKKEESKMVIIQKEKDQARSGIEKKKEMVVKKEEKVEMERKKEIVKKEETKQEKEKKKRGRKRKEPLDKSKEDIAWDGERFIRERAREMTDFTNARERAKIKAIEYEQQIAQYFLPTIEDELGQFLKQDDLKIFDLADVPQYSQIQNKIDLSMMKDKVEMGFYSTDLSLVQKDLQRVFGNFNLCYAEDRDMMGVGRERQKIMHKAFDSFLTYLSVKEKHREKWLESMEKEIEAEKKSKKAPAEASGTGRKRKKEETESVIPRKPRINID